MSRKLRRMSLVENKKQELGRRELGGKPVLGRVVERIVGLAKE